MVFELLLPVGA